MNMSRRRENPAAEKGHKAPVHLTGSSYSGESRSGRMEGLGRYKFASGAVYVGEMVDGVFHGRGTLHFPGGGTFEAVWEYGRAVGFDPGLPTLDSQENPYAEALTPEAMTHDSGGLYTFGDGLQYCEMEWPYCDGFDRRFFSEACKGLKPAGRSQQTDCVPDRLVPLGLYDCGDGFYDPERRVVMTYKGNKFLRNADVDEHEWIVRTCRKGVQD